MNSVATILIVTAFILSVVGIIKPNWPAVAVSVLLMCVALFLKFGLR